MPFKKVTPKPVAAPHGRTVEGGQIRKQLAALERLILMNDKRVAAVSINHILRNLDALEEKYAALAKTEHDARRNPEQPK